MNHLTQITFTKQERWLLNKIMCIATARIANVLEENEYDKEDRKDVEDIEPYHQEVIALSMKLNLDKIRN